MSVTGIKTINFPILARMRVGTGASVRVPKVRDKTSPAAILPMILYPFWSPGCGRFSTTIVTTTIPRNMNENITDVHRKSYPWQ
jgi:hypothetical protein